MLKEKDLMKVKYRTNKESEEKVGFLHTYVMYGDYDAKKEKPSLHIMAMVEDPETNKLVPAPYSLIQVVREKKKSKK